jgi:hypothetical protein
MSHNFKDDMTIDNNKYLGWYNTSNVKTSIVALNSSNNLLINNGGGSVSLNPSGSSHTFINSGNTGLTLVGNKLAVGYATTANTNSSLTIASNGYLSVNTSFGNNTGYLGFTGSNELSHSAGSSILSFGQNHGSLPGHLQFYTGTTGEHSFYTGADTKRFQILANGTSNFLPNGTNTRLSITDTQVSVSSTTASVNATTGALIVSGGVGVSGNISVTGNVDGRDVSVDGGNLDNLYTTIGLSALTTAEVDQLENINSTVISTTQWGYIGAMNQGVASTNSVVFAGITTGNTVITSTTASVSATTGALVVAGGIGVNGNISITGNVDGRDVSVDGGNLDNLYTTIGLSALTTAEVDQLENINSTVISTTQWGYIGAMNQGVASTNSVVFAGITTGNTVITSTTSVPNTTNISSVGQGALNVSGDLTMGSAKSIHFPSTSLAAPTFSTRSAGTRIVLYPTLGASATDFAFGMESGGMWSSLDLSTNFFKWYGGTTLFMTLTGTGMTLDVPEIIDVTSTTALVARKNAAGGDVLAIDTTNTSLKLGPGAGIQNSLLSLYGTTTNAAVGPHILCTTTQDTYPTFQLFNYAHNNVTLNFDAYYASGTSDWRSSSFTSNFQIAKFSNALQFNYASSVSQGSAVTFSTGLSLSNDGVFTTSGITRVNSTTTIASTTNPTTSSGGSLNVSGDLILGSTNPRIYFPQNGLGIPTFTSRSPGAKLVLYPDISATSVGYSIGINTNTLWSSVTNTSASFHWYAGTTKVMDLSGVGTLNITSTIASVSATTGALVVAGGIGINGSISITGNVDGRDISVDGSTLDNLNTTIGLSALTTAEVDQLENINSTVISTTQWGYLGAMNQGVASTSSVVFAGITTGNTVITSTTSVPNTTNISSAGSGALNVFGDLTMGASKDIIFAQGSVAAPTFTTRSSGTRIVLYPGISGASADYAIGIDNSTFWSSLDAAGASFKWYGGTTLAMTLTGAGNLTLPGYLTTASSGSYLRDTYLYNSFGTVNLYFSHNALLGDQIKNAIISNFSGSWCRGDFHICVNNLADTSNVSLTDSVFNINVNKRSSFTVTTDSTSTSSGSVVISGGVGIAKKMFVGGKLTVAYQAGAEQITLLRSDGGTNIDIRVDSTNTLRLTNQNSNGDIIFNGGSGGDYFDFGASGSTTTAPLYITDSTTSTNTSTGAFIVSGGAGIAGRLSVGGLTRLLSATASTTVSSGAVVISGGTGIVGGLNVGGISRFENSTTIANTSDVASSSGGALNIDGDLVLATTNPRLYFPRNNTGFPTFTTRSAGTKIVLFSDIGGSTVDYAIGIGSNTLWSSVNTTTGSFHWYAGTTRIMDLDGLGDLMINGTIESTNATTGALVVAGGVGIVKRLTIGGQITSTVTTGTAPFVVASTTNVANLNASTLSGATFASPGSIGSTTPGSGAFTTLSASGISSITNTTESASNTSGALVVSGGVGIAKALRVGGVVSLTNGTSSTTPYTGTLLVTGGVGISQSLNVESGITLFSDGAGLSFNFGGSFIKEVGSGLRLQLTTPGGSPSSGYKIVSTTSSILRNYTNTTITDYVPVSIIDTTESASSTSGALVVSGGVGIAKALFVGGNIQSLRSTSGDQSIGVYSQGGSSRAFFAADNLVDSGWSFGQDTDKAFRFKGGAVSGNNFSTATTQVTFKAASAGVEIHPVTESSSTVTGALVVGGGVGIAKNLNVGGTAKVNSTTASTSSSTGALTVAGGVGITGNVYVNGYIQKQGSGNTTTKVYTTTYGRTGVGSTVFTITSAFASAYYGKVTAILGENSNTNNVSVLTFEIGGREGLATAWNVTERHPQSAYFWNASVSVTSGGTHTFTIQPNQNRDYTYTIKVELFGSDSNVLNSIVTDSVVTTTFSY